MIKQLTIQESTELESYEHTIEAGLKSFVEVGNALQAIRDKRLYKETHDTFEEYAQEKWDLSTTHTYRLMEAAQVDNNLSPMGDTPRIERHARPLARLKPEQQRKVWGEAIDTAPQGNMTAKHIEAVAEEMYPKEKPLANHQLINTSSNNEWYTPRKYIEAARTVLGNIDLDPASSAYANETIHADKYYTIEDDGLRQRWDGRVFLNPPYGKDGKESNQALWSRTLIEQYEEGIVLAAVLLVNAVPGNRWFAPLWDFPICFPDHRIRFYNESGEVGQPTHSNALVYLGDDVDTFAEIFSEFGVVAVRYGYANTI